MFDDIADGEGLVHGVGAGGSDGHVHGALPVLFHVLGGLLRFGGGTGRVLIFSVSILILPDFFN